MEIDLFRLDHALLDGVNLGKGRVRHVRERGQGGRRTLFPQRTMGILFPTCGGKGGNNEKRAVREGGRGGEECAEWRLCAARTKKNVKMFG